MAAKAFDEMDRREPGGELAKAKRAACVGVVKMFTSGQCGTDDLRDAMRILERDKSASAVNILGTVKRWASEVNVYF